MNYGYARCSTNETRQDIDRQKRDLLEMGVSNERYIFCEYESGTKTDRKQLNELLSIVEPGDTITTTEVSRLSRSTKHLCEILDQVKSEKLCLRIGQIVVDCTKDEIDPMTQGMIQMWAVFAEMERNMIRQRVLSGLANAKAKGKVFGRPYLTIDKLPDKFYRAYALYKNGSINLTEMANMTELSRPTINKYIKMIEKAGD